MFIYWKALQKRAYLLQNLHKKNDNQKKNFQGKQTHSWMDLLAIIELHRWGFPGGYQDDWYANCLIVLLLSWWSEGKNFQETVVAKVFVC